MTELKQLGLSLRTYNCLKRAKIDTVEQLAQVSDADLLRLRGFGVWCLNEVRQKVPKPSMTNADRIRAMTDEELADCLYYELLDEDGSHDCIMRWLKQSAEVTHGNT